MDWNNFFFKLQERGLTGVKLVISYGHKGIMKAVRESFPESLWQYCHFHFIKNLRKTVGKDQWKSISRIVSEALMDESLFKIAIDRMEKMKLNRSLTCCINGKIHYTHTHHSPKLIKESCIQIM